MSLTSTTRVPPCLPFFTCLRTRTFLGGCFSPAGLSPVASAFVVVFAMIRTPLVCQQGAGSTPGGPFGLVTTRDRSVTVPPRSEGDVAPVATAAPVPAAELVALVGRGR